MWRNLSSTTITPLSHGVHPPEMLSNAPFVGLSVPFQCISTRFNM